MTNSEVISEQISRVLINGEGAPEAAESSAVKLPESAEGLEALLREAEERGFQRGRNERLEEHLDGRGLLELAIEAEEVAGISRVEILRDARPCIWDM